MGRVWLGREAKNAQGASATMHGRWVVHLVRACMKAEHLVILEQATQADVPDHARRMHWQSTKYDYSLQSLCGRPMIRGRRHLEGGPPGGGGGAKQQAVEMT